LERETFRVIADDSPVETLVRIDLSRDRIDLLRTVLVPHSIVVIGGRRRLWPTLGEGPGSQIAARRS
jgi:hypothetical protein